MQPLTYRGRVTGTQDPMGLGRVQVNLQGFGAQVGLPWIRMLQPSASSGSGFVFLPEKGDEVLVIRSEGDSLDGLIILGAIYNGNSKPPVLDRDGENREKCITTRYGNAIRLHDEEGHSTITLETKDGRLRLKLDEDAMEIQVESDREIVIRARKHVQIRSESVEILGSNEVTVRASGKVSVHAASIALEGGQVELGL